MANCGAIDFDRVHIIHNLDDVAIAPSGKTHSLDLAEYYATKRGIPAENIHGLNLGDTNASYFISTADFDALMVYAEAVQNIILTHEPTHVIFSCRCPYAYYCPDTDPNYTCLQYIVRISLQTDNVFWTTGILNSVECSQWRPYQIDLIPSGQLGGNPCSGSLSRWKELIDEAYAREQAGGISSGTALIEYHGPNWEEDEFETLVSQFEDQGFTTKLTWPNEYTPTGRDDSDREYLLTRSTIGMGASDGICNIDPLTNTTEAACTAAGGTWYPWQDDGGIDAGDRGGQGYTFQIDPNISVSGLDVGILNWFRNRQYIRGLWQFNPGAFVTCLTSAPLSFGWGALEWDGACLAWGCMIEPYLTYELRHDWQLSDPTTYGAAFCEATCFKFDHRYHGVWGDPLYRPFQWQDPPRFDNTNLEWPE